MYKLIDVEYKVILAALAGVATCFAPVKWATKDWTYLLALLSKQRSQSD